MSDNQLSMAMPAGSDQGSADENDRAISEIQDLRKRGIASLMKEGKFPECMEDRAFMIQLMNGVTNTALGVKKVKANEKQAASEASIVKSLVEVIRINNSTQQAAGRKSAAERSAVPMLDVKVVPGHTDQGTRAISTTSVANGGDGYLDKA